MVAVRHVEREPVAPSRTTRCALALRRRFPGRSAVLLVIGTAVVAWATAGSVHALAGPSVLGPAHVLVLAVVSVLLVVPLVWMLLTLTRDLDLEMARRRQIEHQLVVAGVHEDDRTGLANRRSLIIDLTERLADGTVEAVALLALDEYRPVHCWHARADDDAVVAVARAATAAVGSRGAVSRLGNEEFAVVVLPGEEPLEELLARLLWFVRAAGEQLGRTAAVGATTVEPGDTVDAVLVRAATALSQLEPSGHRRIGIHRPQVVIAPG